MFAEITSNSIRKVTPDGKVVSSCSPADTRGGPYGGKEPGSNGMTLDDWPSDSGWSRTARCVAGGIDLPQAPRLRCWQTRIKARN